MYNNFPVGYPQENKSAVIWVQGIEGAKSYYVAPNQAVTLWDSEAQTIYIKQADMTGLPSMKILDYTIRESSAISGDIKPEQTFATMDDIDNLREEISALRSNIEDMTKKEKK